MAGIRDPAFWKRFSTAVHRDEESNPNSPNPNLHRIPTGTSSPSSSRPALKHSYALPLYHPGPSSYPLTLLHRDTWLARNAAKRSRLRCIGWSIVCALIIFIAAVVLVVLYLKGKLIPGQGGSGAGAEAGKSGEHAPPMESGLVTATGTAVQSAVQGVAQTASAVVGAATGAGGARV